MKEFKARIKSKHDTTANWNNAIGFIPMAGEVIIYDDYKTISVEENGQTITKSVPGIKIGSGNAYIQDLPFVDDELRDKLLAHIADTDVHVTSSEKDFWNNKVNIDDAYEILNEELEGEMLIFNRN